MAVDDSTIAKNFKDCLNTYLDLYVEAVQDKEALIASQYLQGVMALCLVYTGPDSAQAIALSAALIKDRQEKGASGD